MLAAVFDAALRLFAAVYSGAAAACLALAL
jgi:hypothetical protein